MQHRCGGDRSRRSSWSIRNTVRYNWRSAWTDRDAETIMKPSGYQDTRGLDEARDAEDMDETLDIGKTDEEILMAFLRDGCDLDGTPLRLIDDPGAAPEYGYDAGTLH
jgi:hypothetical protein